MCPSQFIQYKVMRLIVNQQVLSKWVGTKVERFILTSMKSNANTRIKIEEG